MQLVAIASICMMGMLLFCDSACTEELLDTYDSFFDGIDYTFFCPVPDCETIILSQQKEQAKSAMLSHVKRHFYRCENGAVCCLCGSGLLSKYLLKAHLKRHLLISPYACMRCSYTCFSYARLIKHMKNHYDPDVIHAACILSFMR